MIHVSAQYLTVYCTAGEWQFDASAAWRSLCAAGVPLFLMCSGALMLRPEKELPLKRLYLHNILRLVIAMLVWSFAYKLWGLYFPGSSTARASCVRLRRYWCLTSTFIFTISTSCCWCIFPARDAQLRKNASEKEMNYFLLAWFALGILYPTLRPYRPLSLIQGFPTQWAMNMSYAAIGYGVLGCRLCQKRLPAKTGAAIAAAGLAAVLLPTVFVSRANGALFEGCLNGMSVAVCLFAAGLYILGLCAGEKYAQGAALSSLSRVRRSAYILRTFSCSTCFRASARSV